MALTPEDVQNKEFTTVRLREGYDMQEVDNFLDEVEAELGRLVRENEELREKLAAATRQPAPEPPRQPEPVRQVAPPPPPPEPVAPPAPAPVPVAAPASAEAATKVLALAQKTADELVGEAKSEAERMLEESRSRAEQLDADTKMKAAKLEQEARQRSEEIEREAREQRNQVFGNLEVEREKLQRAVDTLRAFEREYRSRLKAYLESQLRQLESTGMSDSGQVAAHASAPSGAVPNAAAPGSSNGVLEDNEHRV